MESLRLCLWVLPACGQGQGGTITDSPGLNVTREYAKGAFGPEPWR